MIRLGSKILCCISAIVISGFLGIASDYFYGWGELLGGVCGAIMGLLASVWYFFFFSKIFRANSAVGQKRFLIVKTCLCVAAFFVFGILGIKSEWRYGYGWYELRWFAIGVILVLLVVLRYFSLLGKFPSYWARKFKFSISICSAVFLGMLSGLFLHIILLFLAGHCFGHFYNTFLIGMGFGGFAGLFLGVLGSFSL